MGKKKKKNIERRRQKKIASQKKKRDTRHSMFSGSAPKQLSQGELMDTIKELQDGETFAKRISELELLLENDTYFKDVRYKPDLLLDHLQALIDKYEQEIESWDIQKFSTIMNNEVIPKINTLEFRMTVYEIFDRATRSSRFVGELRKSMLVGFMFTTFDQKKDMLSTMEAQGASDFATPLWFIIINTTLNELKENNTQATAIMEKIARFFTEPALNLSEEELEEGEELEDEEIEDAAELADAPPAHVQLEASEITASLAQMDTEINYSLSLTEILHGIPIYSDLEDIADYHALMERSKVSDAFKTTYEKFLQALIDDFHYYTQRRYLEFLEHLPENELKSRMQSYFREVNYNQNPFIISLYLKSLHKWAKDSDPIVRDMFANPANPQNYLIYGNNSFDAGNYDGARLVFTRVIEINREDYRGYHKVALCYERLEDWNQAAENYDIAIDLLEEQLSNNANETDKQTLTELKSALERVEDHLN